MSKTLEAITKAHEQRQGDGFRRHLGASVIGRPCVRQIWYIWRWAKKAWFAGRILRLFERGNREEEIIANRLRQSGIHCLTTNPETGEQFRIEDIEGHFGGSLDLVIYDAPEFPGEWILGECKTHNDESFKKLKKEGLHKSKPEHYAQGQTYMHYTGMPHGLYFAINKNDDDIEVVPMVHDPAYVRQLRERALHVITTPVPPPRINENPAFYLCRMCDYNTVCHQGRPKARNCRTCVHSQPIEKAQWRCNKYNYILSDRDQKRGCADHQEIPE